RTTRAPTTPTRARGGGGRTSSSSLPSCSRLRPTDCRLRRPDSWVRRRHPTEGRGGDMPADAPEQYNSKPKGMLPNSRFPLLVHRGGIPGGGGDAVRDRFRANGWLNN